MLIVSGKHDPTIQNDEKEHFLWLLKYWKTK